MSDLSTYRAQIDALDAQIAPLFLRRMAVTAQVGEYKKAHGIPVLDPGRERQVIAAKTALAEAPADKIALAELYQSIMAISRRQQRKLVREGTEDPGFAHWSEILTSCREPVQKPRVVYQGEPGCYSDEAAAGFFGEEVDARGLPWFDHAFAALERGEADYAILPVENSSTGSIRQVYDLLAQYRFFLVGEWQVRVEHSLAVLPGTGLEDIRTVYSHEQGLMQCDRFLDGHRAWARVPMLDTAGAARQVAESGDRAGAAICSRRAARRYGLEVLAGPINHNTRNYTRFAVVSALPELRPGRDKISALLRLPHQSGSLHEILTVFAVHGLNLMKLESRPEPDMDWEYRFFLDCSGDLTAPGMDGVIHELSQLSSDLRILGNYRGYQP